MNGLKNHFFIKFDIIIGENYFTVTLLISLLSLSSYLSPYSLPLEPLIIDI